MPDTSQFVDLSTIEADTTALLDRITAARAGYIDELSSVNIPSDVDSCISQLDSVMDEARSSGTLTPIDASENDIFINDAPLAIWIFDGGWIDVTNLAAGDTIIIKEYHRIKTGGSMVLYKTTSLTDDQSDELVRIEGSKENRYGSRVTLAQTAGTYRAFDYEFFKWE